MVHMWGGGEMKEGGMMKKVKRNDEREPGENRFTFLI